MGAFQYYNNLYDIPEPFKKCDAEGINNDTNIRSKNINRKDINKTTQANHNIWNVILLFFILNYM